MNICLYLNKCACYGAYKIYLIQMYMLSIEWKKCAMPNVFNIFTIKQTQQKSKLLFRQSNRVYGQLFAYFNSSFPSPALFCAVYAKMITMAALRCTCKLKSVKDFAIHDAHLSGREKGRERGR